MGAAVSKTTWSVSLRARLASSSSKIVSKSRIGEPSLESRRCGDSNRLKIIPGCTPARLAAPPTSTSPTSAPSPTESPAPSPHSSKLSDAGCSGPSDKPRGSVGENVTRSCPVPSTLRQPSGMSSPI
eukprot:scaffold163638_cov33-Tisochrysis_lutea.AAC.1